MGPDKRFSDTPISIKVLNDQYFIKKCDMIREIYVLSYGTIKN
jgi:hypothetical protein